MLTTKNPLLKIGLAPLAIALSGCASAPDQQPKLPAPTAEYRSPAEEGSNPVIRSDRYTLVSITPTPDQTDLLNQIIDIRIPDVLSPSIHEAMTYVLRRSGYQLCPGNEIVNQLYANTLPASQYQLGPITLRSALQVLAGPAWDMNVDELSRTLCFIVKNEYQRPAPAITAGQVFAAPTTKPLQHGGE
ncbi:PilL N-terminal domain-containing protein [Pseudomonas sp. NA-150]|uniref:PFGI-1 class ICE element type IV pilus protein PilL2 n=1 Tax=Pseudomonas sp. NA-150 TaxID=3367525 RepID=UPI0037C6C35E